jgi:hypothetical protein
MKTRQIVCVVFWIQIAFGFFDNTSFAVDYRIEKERR